MILLHIYSSDKEKRKKCQENNCTLFELKYNYTDDDYLTLKNKLIWLFNQ